MLRPIKMCIVLAISLYTIITYILNFGIVSLNSSFLLGGDSMDTTTMRPEPRPRSTVRVKIVSPTIKIQKVGSTVNFTCEAQSRMTPRRLPVNWYKVDGNLPQGRSIVDERRGLLLITNLQVSDSGKYICETTDGMSTEQAIATLKVPGKCFAK